MNKYVITVAVAFTSFGFSSQQASANHQYGEMVGGYYSKYLGRPGDLAGMQQWVCQMECGRSPLWVEAQFLGCHEYYKRCGCCHDGFVRGLFRDVLCEPNPCPTQLHFWCNRLRRCGYNRCALATEFLRFPHRRPAPAVSVRVFTAPPPPPVHIRPIVPPRPEVFYGGPRFGYEPSGCPGGFPYGSRHPYGR